MPDKSAAFRDAHEAFRAAAAKAGTAPQRPAPPGAAGPTQPGQPAPQATMVPPASAHTTGARLLALAAPSMRRAQKLAYSFDEDELTLAWEAVREGALASGTKVAAHLDEAVPEWFWKATGLSPDPGAPLQLRAVATTSGPTVALHEGAAAALEATVEAAARRVLDAAPQRAEAEWQRHRAARDLPDAEADFPLGAHTTLARHNDVLVERLAAGGGTVESWTTIGAGAAPSEFIRLQDAVGAYQVALVALEGGGRTVGIVAAGTLAAGARVRPVLRRLYRQQGVWRHGLKWLAA